MIIDMAGQRFGRWTVLRKAGCDKRRRATWLCRCECGREKAVRGDGLLSGSSNGCKSCASREPATIHGGYGTRIYKVWTAMRQRCGDENCSAFKNYGGRGIAVCPEWDKGFEAFRDWALANGYGKGLSIDRINNDGNYEPNNCRWATRKQQNRNRRDNRLVTVDSVTKTLAEWAELSGLKYDTLYNRLSCGWTPVRAVFAPVVRSGRGFGASDG